MTRGDARCRLINHVTCHRGAIGTRISRRSAACVESTMAQDGKSPSLRGSCHCGAVRLTLPFAPEKATSCNCSICRRVAGLWVYYELGTVTIDGHPGETEGYVWGDRTLRTVRCRTCGVVTHWEPLDTKPGSRHGVNLRNFEPALQQSVAVRRFDGADSWAFLD